MDARRVDSTGQAGKESQMSLSNEVQKMMDESETAGNSLTAHQVVEAAKDAEKFPRLNEHLW
jgi:hypothetical protein